MTTSTHSDARPTVAHPERPILNRILTVFFAIIFAMQLGYLLVGLASIPAYYQRVTQQTVETTQLYGRDFISNQWIAQEAAERGLSLAQFALYRVVFNTILALIPASIALLIIWRAGRQWFAWFTAFVILFLGESGLSEQTIVARLMSFELFGVNAIFWFLVLLFFFLFPNGQRAPRRVGWLVIGLVIYHFFIQAGTVVAYVAPETAARFNLPNWGSPIYIAPVLLNFLIVLACQIYRYRRVSTLIEQQQTKWFLLGFGFIVVLIPIDVITQPSGGFLNDVVDRGLWLPLFVGLAIAILRYRLWDIDILIRRTLQYTLLSGLLALTYFGLVVVLQSTFAVLTGQAQSPLVTVLSTLAIAALVLPLRRRVQDWIDRRFYRKKYDAAKVIADFAATCRDETDLDKLTARLVEVVQETMQPESVSLWLKDPNAKPALSVAEGTQRQKGAKE